MVANVITTFLASFSPLKIRNFRIYLSGQAISLIGTWMQSAAQAWVVWEISGSNSALGIVTALNTLPLLFLVLFTGVWVDRMNRRKLLIAVQVSAMLLAFIFAFLTQTKFIQLWHIYVLSLLLGIVNAFDMPAQQTFLGDLSGMSEIRKAVTLNAIIIQVSRSLGPALAGIVIAQFGAATAFWINGASFLFVIGSLLMVTTMRTTHPKSSKEETDNGLVAALRFLRNQPRLQDVMIFTALVTFFGLSILFTLIPAYASVILKGKEELYGTLLGMSGLGALFSATFVTPIVQTFRRTGLVIGAGVIWMGVWFMLFALCTSVPAALVCMFCVSISGPLVIATSLGLMQMYAPSTMRGRMVSLALLVSFGMQPVAALFVGTSADVLGIAPAIMLNGVLMVGGGALVLLARANLRQWDARTHQSGTSPSLETIQTVGH